MFISVNKNIFGRTKQNNNIKYLVDNNIKITDNSSIAHSMNSFFANVGKNLNNKKRRKKNNKLTNIDTSNSDSFFLEPTDMTEIDKVIKTLNVRSAAGIDGVGNGVIKSLSNFIALPLAYIFNMAVESGIYPDLFKKACIAPYIKAGTFRTKYL